MVAPVPPAVLLLDTSAAIGLLEFSGRHDLADLLVACGFSLEMAPQVEREWMARRRETGTAAARITTIEVDEERVGALRVRFPILGSGELGVLARAQVLEGRERYFAVLDDKRARATAATLGIRTTGTLGLLGFLERVAAISREEALAIHGSLLRAGFRIPPLT